MKKQKAPPRKKPLPFKQALISAKALLAMKHKRRKYLLVELENLNHDIPRLEGTVRALATQLNMENTHGPKFVSDSPAMERTQHSRPVLSGEKNTSIEDIPPEIRAQLPPEDFSGMGSHFGDAPAEEENFLPEIVGDDPIKPKSKVG